MLSRSKVLIMLYLVLTQVSWAYDGLSLEPGSGSQSDQWVSLATEHSLIDQGCRIKARGSNGTTPSSIETLVLRLAPMVIDQTHGRYTGYGIQLDSILWTASIRSQLVEPRTQKILDSYAESAEERQIPSANGSMDLSALATEAQVLDGLTRKLGRQLASKLAETLSKFGVCSSTTPPPQAQSITSPSLHQAASEVKKTEIASYQDASSVPSKPSSTAAPKEMHSTLLPEGAPGEPEGKEYRVALVIGNAHYDHIPTLNNPSNDARFISEQILASGFELVGGEPLLDLNKTKIERAIADFGKRLSQHVGAVGFFYYAGHGIQVNGANYLVPTDANPSRVADLSRQAIGIDSLLQEMEDSRTGLNIIVLDACRNNPFGGRGIRESGSGLAQMRAPKGSMIIYATQPGNIAQDGPFGQNSPFAKALGSALAEPGLDLFGTFNEVGLLVARVTAGEQQPWISSSPIEGRFCFKGCRQ